MQDYHEFLSQILIPADQLQNRIQELAAEISADYQGRDLLLVCILRGGVMFLTDLMRHITIPHAVEFMAVSSYGAGRYESSGYVRITLDMNVAIHDRDVLLVEDIVDSGHTLKEVLALLSTRGPKSLTVCALLDKAERREVEVPIRYTGFTIPNHYVFGYGLDIDEYWRNLPFIGVVALENYRPKG